MTHTFKAAVIIGTNKRHSIKINSVCISDKCVRIRSVHDALNNMKTSHAATLRWWEAEVRESTLTVASVWPSSLLTLPLIRPERSPIWELVTGNALWRWCCSKQMLPLFSVTLCGCSLTSLSGLWGLGNIHVWWCSTHQSCDTRSPTVRRGRKSDWK